MGMSIQELWSLNSFNVLSRCTGGFILLVFILMLLGKVRFLRRKSCWPLFRRAANLGILCCSTFRTRNHHCYLDPLDVDWWMPVWHVGEKVLSIAAVFYPSFSLLCLQNHSLFYLLITPLGPLREGWHFALGRQYYSIELSLSLFIAFNNYEISHKMSRAS